MPYSAAQLTAFYTTLTVGRTPGATLTPLIANTAAQDAAGQITDAQAFAVVSSMSNDVRSTGDVAVATYALFTGATPSQAGINYLVNNPGTGYNTSYYNGVGGTPTNLGPGGFNAENRYYNAAINLAATVGAPGYANFNATFGGLTLAQTISTAYNTIIGSAVTTTAAQAAINSITNSLPYFQALASQLVASGSSVDLATKAIIAGYILEEGIKADVGVYAQALDGFNAADAMGNGVFNTNLLTTFGAGGSAFNPALQPFVNGQTFTSSATSLTSEGVAAGGQATLNVGSNATVTFTGDTAINTGQLTVNEGAGSGVLNLAYTGQITSTAASVIASGVSVVNLSATGVAGALLSVDIENSSLTTLNIRGSESVAYSAPLYAFLDGTFSFGALTTINASGATAPVNIDVSSMPSTANASASGGVTVMGTTGADTFSVRNFATVTGGGGNDTVVLYSTGNVSAVPVVTDAHAGVTVGFAGLNATTFNATAISATSVQNGLDQAAAKGAGTVSYFQVGGDTYLVADNSAANTFQFGSDYAIRLVGAHALAGSTLTGTGQIVLAG